MTAGGDDVNLPFVTIADLEDRAEQASRNLDDLFRLSNLAHDMRTDTDHPVVATALGMVSDELTDLVPQALATAEYARQAVLTGALVATPEGDELNRPDLTLADLKARTVRADRAVDAAVRTLELVSAKAAKAIDPATQRAWWELYDTANEEYERARQVSRLAWDRHTARWDADHGPSHATYSDADPPDSSGNPSDEDPSDS